ncbi:copper-binding protein [Rhodobacteraceae bacterium 2CG4]|uniref:Copper-binding protein n=1 Tax=Halovulum marinum TaxID=2662447 RepID=A0A6L5YX05_9RHOB|nr:plastocyanin/azurin family copper-binding protein [Halovulum marinum]MSU88479.1 copper-binding protein [Halovulum marinum]
MQYKTTLGTALAACALAVSSSFALASPGHGDKPDIGQSGDVSSIDRVIEVEMTEMKFTPEDVEIEKGETVKFIVSNEGRAVHEFNLGTESMWDDHRGEMRKMMKAGLMTVRELRHDKMMAAGMMHDDANSVLLEPGETAEIIWTFSGDAEIGFACNVPGHRAAGMVGTFSTGGADVSS